MVRARARGCPGRETVSERLRDSTGGAGETGHRDDFERWIQLLVDAGAPLDGLGLQSHFGLALTGPEEVVRLLDRYGATFDKDVAVTEYDINVNDENLAGCFTHDFMTAV